MNRDDPVIFDRLTDAQKTRLVANSSNHDTTFYQTGREVMRITADGRLVAGEGLSHDQAGREFFRCLTEVFQFNWDTRAELVKENELLKSKVLEMDQTILGLRHPGIKIPGLL